MYLIDNIITREPLFLQTLQTLEVWFFQSWKYDKNERNLFVKYVTSFPNFYVSQFTEQPISWLLKVVCSEVLVGTRSWEKKICDITNHNFYRPEFLKRSS